MRIAVSQICLQFKVQTVTGFFEPCQFVRLKCFGIGHDPFPVQSGIGINGQVTFANDGLCNFDTFDIFCNTGTANLHFAELVTLIEIALHLVTQPGIAFFRVIAATRIGIDQTEGLAAVMATGNFAVERHFPGFADCVPDGDINCGDGMGAVAVATNLFILHQAVMQQMRIDIAIRIQQAVRVGFHKPRHDPFTQNLADGVASVRGVAVADDGLAVDDHIGFHSNEAEGDFAEINDRIADIGFDASCLLDNSGNAHCGFVSGLQWCQPDTDANPERLTLKAQLTRNPAYAG